VLGAFTILFSASTAFAATKTAATATPQSTGNALKVSPVRNDLEIKPGASQTVDIYVQNMTSGSTKLRAIINDFVAGKDENGTPNIILDADQAAPSHSLKQYVEAIGDFTLAPNEQKNIKVKVTIPATASAGGYFGAVRFAPSSSTSDQNVTLSASVGSLLLVKVPGDIKEDLSVASFDVRKDDKPGNFFTSGKGLKSIVRFQNKGDVQEAPFGKVILKKGAKTLASYEINNVQPRGNVLPDSIRRFGIDLDKVSAFGKYKVEGNFGYGSKGQLLTASQTFYVVPIPVIVTAFVVLILIVLAIFVAPRMVKNYNRRVVQKATGSRRK
jgi:hypothetical protein